MSSKRNDRVKSKPATIPKLNPPVTPQLTSITGDGNIRIIIRPGQNSNITDINGYDLSYTNTVTGVSYRLNINKSQTRVNITGLTVGTLYAFRIRPFGFDDTTTYPYSDVITDTPVILPPPVKNGDPLASDRKVVVNWTSPVSIPSGFSLINYVMGCTINDKDKYTPPDPVVTDNVVSKETLTYTFTNATNNIINNVLYNFIISARYSRTKDGVDSTIDIPLVVAWSPLIQAELNTDSPNFTFSRFSANGYNICQYKLNVKEGHLKYYSTFTSGAVTGTRTETATAANTIATYLTNISTPGGLLNNITLCTYSIVSENKFNKSIQITGEFSTGREPIPNITVYAYRTGTFQNPGGTKIPSYKPGAGNNRNQEFNGDISGYVLGRNDLYTDRNLLMSAVRGCRLLMTYESSLSGGGTVSTTDPFKIEAATTYRAIGSTSSTVDGIKKMNFSMTHKAGGVMYSSGLMTLDVSVLY
jgi:hypothetical protein